MKLRLVPKLEQQQILAPQMILSMDILLLNSLDLENRIEKEFMENPALEVAEPEIESPASLQDDEGRDPEIQQILDVLAGYESRYGGEEAPRRRSTVDSDLKHDALMNHADRPATLQRHIEEELLLIDLEPELHRACVDLVGNIDQRGYLIGDLDDLAQSLGISTGLASKALEVIQGLEPTGIGARDLRECLLQQLGSAVDCLEYKIIDQHLQDLLENRLPRIAENLGVPLREVNEALEMISHLDPHPGSAFNVNDNQLAVPELFIDEVDGRFVVRIEEGELPTLRVSPTCSALLRENSDNPQVVEFVRRKVEAARWLIHAIDQRRRTLTDIAQAIVDHQEKFFRRGPGNKRALTMQQIADQVNVHISTVSRATNGKFIETPYGVLELRKFFTGGVERADGGIESRDNVCGVIREIVSREDTKRPFSDSQLTRKLQERGLEIARRTVTKYRERAGVPAARLRKKYTS